MSTALLDFNWDSIQTWVLTWSPLIFMAAIVFILWKTLKLMPLKTKPQQIKPASSASTSWEDIAGVDEAKHELREVVEFLRDPKRFKKLGARVPKGILLHGPPGTGKTLLAKAVAHDSRANFFSQSAASFVEMFAGLGAARIRRLFGAARKAAPAIIFIDELDAVGGRRGADISGEKDQTLNQLLVEMDGFSSADDVVVIAASNLLEKLDPALLRPGRFDRQIFVSPPDVKGREGILEVHTRGKPLGEVDLPLIARQTSGLTGADLANICNEAAIFAARRGGELVTQTDFDSGLERVRAASSTSTRSASSPTTRRATRSAPSCCRASTACTRSRSCPAGGRWATRSTCPPRTVTSRRARSCCSTCACCSGAVRRSSWSSGRSRPAPPTTSSA